MVKVRIFGVIAIIIISALSLWAQAPPEDAAAKAFLAGDLVKAERLLEKETRGGAEVRPSRHLLLARTRFGLGKWADAQEALTALLDVDPDNPQGRELRGRVLLRLDRPKEALPYYEESVRQTDRSELRLELAEALIALDRPTEAIPHLKRLVEETQPRPRAHYLLGSLRLENGLGRWAGRQLWAALQLGCKERDLRLKLAKAFLQEGRVTGALRRVGPIPEGRTGDRTEDRILVREAEPKGKGFWYAAAPDTAIYQIEAAIAEWKMTRVEAEEPVIAARCWLIAGDAERAAGYATLIDTRSPESFSIAVEIALAVDDIDGLQTFLAKSKRTPDQLPPKETVVRYLLDAALAAQVKGRMPEALAFLERADAILPGRSDVLRSTIDVLVHMGREKEARAKMRLLAELHPDSPEVRILAARHGVDFGAMERAGVPILEEKGGEE